MNLARHLFALAAIAALAACGAGTTTTDHRESGATVAASTSAEEAGDVGLMLAEATALLNCGAPQATSAGSDGSAQSACTETLWIN